MGLGKGPWRIGCGAVALPDTSLSTGRLITKALTSVRFVA
jgi:hypothetical protein